MSENSTAIISKVQKMCKLLRDNAYLAMIIL